MSRVWGLGRLVSAKLNSKFEGSRIKSLPFEGFFEPLGLDSVHVAAGLPDSKEPYVSGPSKAFQDVYIGIGAYLEDHGT